MWNEANNKLTKVFKFPDFKSALLFVNMVGEIAEKIGHHPDIWLSWGSVTVSTTTHDKGNSITLLDHNLTGMIDDICL
jgi:4a-hydroxytetrahydrobiopterin dehydratase